MTARAFLAGVAAVATIAAAAAQADPWKPKDRQAVALLNQAIDAGEAGDYTHAAALSIQSYNVAPSLLALWNAGQAQMVTGDYTRALALYDHALGDRNLPRVRRPQLAERRDLARAFINAKEAAAAARWDDARAAYLAILERDGLLPPDRQHAGEDLAQLADQRAATERAAVTAKPPPTEPDLPSSTAPAPGPTVPLRVEQAAPAPTPAARGSRWDDTAALVIGGVGVAAVGVGVGLYIHAGQLDDRARAVGTPDEDRADLFDRADGERTAAPIVLGIGAAVLVAGAVKFAIPSDASRSTVATLAPTSGGAVVVFAGRF